ncbi:putative alpha-l-rhamnosidase protein [Cladophialophora carrionii]|uniref:alpha-L-rhamnosidase n=1 Tax=Cladophialophora carrionii TaxID=86049 RepID=A0A1C1CEE8_9EURO|nr:putative alpha-l-rhamnosidase protein [Cladophialophora carrionii]
MVRLELKGPSGSIVRVRYSETLGENGLVVMPDALFKDFETRLYSKITLAGPGGNECWMPDFSFTSARYVQIEGASLHADDDLTEICSFTAWHVSSASRRIGNMKTDKEDVNALIDACHWSFSSNIFSLHTDCPQIEKFGWLEVTWLLAPATQYVIDAEALYAKILDDIVDTQDSDGLVPTMAPQYRFMTGPLRDTITWGCAICFLSEIVMRYYGSTVVMAKVYRACVRYMEYMRTKERQGGLIEHGLGDWGRDVAFGNHQANIETAVYYRCLKNIALMAQELGHSEDVLHFEAWAARIYDTYNRCLLVTDRKQHPYAFYTSLDKPGTHDRTMIAQAVALQFDLVPAEHRADIIRAFLDDVEESGHRMRAGEIGLKFLWNTLAEPEVDRPDIVLAMARQEEHPSYMRFLRRGETTLPEFWQDACRSKCHDMLGTIYEWFYAVALGVRPVDDAYKTWTLRPPFRSEFDFLQGEIDCPYGLIKVAFDRRNRSDGTALVTVTVPTSTVCKLRLPSSESVVKVRRDGSEKTVAVSGVEMELLQGTYNLQIQP